MPASVTRKKMLPGTRIGGTAAHSGPRASSVGRFTSRMTGLIPNRFLFDFEFPLSYLSNAPALDGRLRGWSDPARVPALWEIDGRKGFATIWAGWNETGLFFGCRVSGKRRRPEGDAKRYWESDGLRVCVNMRPAPNLRRATRFCRQLFFLPRGGGRGAAVCGSAPFQRARESAPDADPGDLHVAASVDADGYSLEGRAVRRALPGFDPVEHPRIGFFVIVEDSELGQQSLTVGDDLLWYVDPSTWATARLAQEG